MGRVFVFRGLLAFCCPLRTEDNLLPGERNLRHEPPITRTGSPPRLSKEAYSSSQWILMSLARALNSGSPVTNSERVSFASAAAKASAKLSLNRAL